MVAGSVGPSLQVAASRTLATGRLTHDDGSQTFDSVPDLPWPAGAEVDAALDSDVRFSGPVPSAALRASYLHSEGTLWPSHAGLAGADQLRVIPERPLEAGRVYHLVLDAYHEIAVRAVAGDTEAPVIASVRQDSVGIRIRFSGPINPLTLYRGAVRLECEDGTSVGFSTIVSAGQDEIVLIFREGDLPAEGRAGRS